jgi:hypothetical protein
MTIDGPEKQARNLKKAKPDWKVIDSIYKGLEQN